MKAKTELSRTDAAAVVPQNPNRSECCVRRLRKEISKRRQGNFKIKVLSPALRASCDQSSSSLCKGVSALCWKYPRLAREATF